MMALALGIVVATALALVALALCIAYRPRLAERLLRGFASSALTHYLEQLLRLVAGTSLVIAAGEMKFEPLFRALGWIIVVTSALLLLVPWQWHHRFGQWAIPLAIRHLRSYGLCALLLGAFMLYSVLPG